MKLSYNLSSLLIAFVVSLLVSGVKAQTHSDIVVTVPVTGANPGRGWYDSYSVGDRCYCESSFDHGIGAYQVETPLGWRSVREACALLGPGPGSSGRPKYNDIQCGNGPPNDAGDEHTCPGRSDIGPEGCGQIGPKWNFDLRDAHTTSTTSFYVNCGAGEEDLLNGSFWTDASGKSIANTGSYSENDFKTARSGNGFTYTIGGFASGVTATITLGWAELWTGACSKGVRMFDVFVNGAPFVVDFDVSGTAGGCFKAVFETKSFQANADGTFILEFEKGSRQNPLINVIDIRA